MKTQNILLVILITVMGSYSYAGPNNGRFLRENTNKIIPAQELTKAEQDSLIFMREEEKLARDVYLTLDEYFDVSLFGNIAKAEQKHMNAMKRLLDKYGISDPVTDDNIGLFMNPEFADFYNSNTVFGMTIQDALLVGILIEEMDINDLQKSINSTNRSDIKNVYENLLRGSRNHLRAFVRKLESMGVIYEALLLDQSEADAIVNTPMERGSPKRKGSWAKKGQWWN